MKRNVISIDEEKCNGCGLCVSGCPEGAIQLIDGKARLVAENYCDGLGACIGECPLGAIETNERDAVPYDERATIENILPKGENTIRAHLRHLYLHGETAFLNEAIAVLAEKKIVVPDYVTADAVQPCPLSSSPQYPGNTDHKQIQKHVVENVSLQSWPIQLKLLSMQAPFFHNADIVFAADCTAFACSTIHLDYLKNRVTIIFCPKLDQNTEEYVEKISQILTYNKIRSIEVLRMEVPCCGGTTYIVKEALARSGKNYHIKETVIHRDGSVIE